MSNTWYFLIKFYAVFTLGHNYITNENVNVPNIATISTSHKFVQLLGYCPYILDLTDGISHIYSMIDSSELNLCTSLF